LQLQAFSAVAFDALQVDRASSMVEKLCTPSDDEHNEHKRLQLRELAALNGTLKDITACFVCGDEGHDAEHCPKKVRFAAVHLCSVLGILEMIV
jgi:hypothetical protein